MHNAKTGTHTLDAATTESRNKRLMQAYIWFVWSVILEFCLFLRVSRSWYLLSKFLRAHERTTYYHVAGRSDLAGAPHFVIRSERDRQRVYVMGTRRFPEIDQVLCAMVPHPKGLTEEITYERAEPSASSATWRTVFETREMLWSQECAITLAQLRQGW